MLTEENDCLLPFLMAQRLKGKLQRIAEPLVQPEELTILQSYCLILISQQDMTVGALSEQLLTGQANTSTMCKKLEKAGYLKRVRKAEDERVVTLKLTEQGEQTLERIRDRAKQYAQSFRQLPPQVLDDLRRGLQAADFVLDYLSSHSCPTEQEIHK